MGAVGDLVQALPALRAVRSKWPAARITLVGRPERAAVARMAGYVDDCADFDDPTKAAVAGADLVVDFLSKPAPLPPARRVSRPAARKPEPPCPLAPTGRGGSGDPPRTVPEGSPLRIAINPLPPADWAHPAAVWILREATARLDLPPVPDEPEVRVPTDVLEAARNILKERGIAGPFVAIHPGSGSLKKNWPMDRFLRIARRLRAGAGRQVAWLIGPAEVERGTLPPAEKEKGPGPLTPSGVLDPFLLDLDLQRLAGVLAIADAYLGNDSGITHLAVAVRRPGINHRAGADGRDGRATPTVALFGPSDPRVWAPRGRHVRIIRSRDGEMAGIDVERVWAAIKL
jgi:ADP-heptose:LPS heptosyltransferase